MTALCRLPALRMPADRREELTRARIQTVNRLHRLLSELTPGHAKKDITALQAKAILASVRPRDLAGKTRRREAMRCLKRRISDAVYRQLLADAHAAAAGADPGGHCGASLISSAVDSHPPIDTSDQPHPDPLERRYAARPRPRKTQPEKTLQYTG